MVRTQMNASSTTSSWSQSKAHSHASENANSMVQYNSNLNHASTSNPVNSQGHLSTSSTADIGFIIMPSVASNRAFLDIARVLQLACEQDSGFNIRAPIHSLPSSLIPTPKQESIPHRPYVDMIPWSSLRNRILICPSAINEIELVIDLMSGDIKVWGMTAWDPMSWEVGPEFARKWWFLLDETILHTTNFWRRQRGEEALELQSG